LQINIYGYIQEALETSLARRNNGFISEEGHNSCDEGKG
jgi:hypothetical protein